MWEYLDLIRVYTQPKGKPIDPEPVVLYSTRCTVRDFCDKIHSGLIDDFNYALVTGTSVKHFQCKCGRDHELQDGDVVTIC